MLFVTGLIDDFRRLRPHTKLIAQIVAACLLVFGGVQIGTPWLAAAAIPLTILWVVGITNAFNLLDNMDGLSAGTACIAPRRSSAPLPSRSAAWTAWCCVWLSVARHSRVP